MKLLFHDLWEAQVVEAVDLGVEDDDFVAVLFELEAQVLADEACPAGHDELHAS